MILQAELFGEESTSFFKGLSVLETDERIENESDEAREACPVKDADEAMLVAGIF